MKKVSILETSTVLVLMLVIMGLGVIKFKLSPQTPVLLVLGLITMWAKLRGFEWEDINQGIKNGIETGIIPSLFLF
ncbi:hypothetical protein S100892_00158 [Pediococcus pentosaceus]|uniref:Uncharacterized protein n=1 Tax=Pediococcus pentosaceus TaxID=1255 RepID=A0A1Y0VMS3_PEDPE|nr:hypothetical protein S100892_00158 [Pediococcus pentosaceus]